MLLGKDLGSGERLLVMIVNVRSGRNRIKGKRDGGQKMGRGLRRGRSAPIRALMHVLRAQLANVHPSTLTAGNPSHREDKFEKDINEPDCAFRVHLVHTSHTYINKSNHLNDSESSLETAISGLYNNTYFTHTRGRVTRVACATHTRQKPPMPVGLN